MVAALSESELCHESVVFEDEQHGFRTAEAREAAPETELSFYGAVSGSEPAEEVPEVELAVGE